MAKRTIEINDTLEERVEGAISEVKQLLLDFCEENEPDELPCLNNDLDYSGSVHEIVDGSVPIYTSEIEDIWYLWRNELETAYENAYGSEHYEDDSEKHMQACIYFYIQEQVNDWYESDAQEIFDDWQEEFNKQTEAV